MPAPRSDRNALDFFCAVIIVGVLAGIAGVATTLVLRVVQHATYHYSFGALLAGVAASSPIRRVLGPMVGAALAGLGWWLLRRRTDVPPLAETIARSERVPRLAWSIDAVLQVLLVGSGASLGRRAPRANSLQRSAISVSDGSDACRRATGRSCWPARRGRSGRGVCGAAGRCAVRGPDPAAHLAAAGGGAAFLSSGVAVAVGSAVTGDQPNLRWPVEESTYLLTAHGLLLAPVALAVGLVFNRLMAVARPARPMRTWTLIPALAGAGLVTGVCSHWWPELPGNGRSILTVSLASGMTLASALAILLLKPVLTALFLRAAARGRPVDAVAGHRGGRRDGAGADDQLGDREPAARARGVAGRRRRGAGRHPGLTDLGGDLRLGAGPATAVAVPAFPADRDRRARAESACPGPYYDARRLTYSARTVPVRCG
ncbi:putative membrane protein [Mycobacterium avium subsp. avium 2285 (R)]|nr:putative membrane protein [Mycobacterium avium subsp. avium 2285 (R)]